MTKQITAGRVTELGAEAGSAALLAERFNAAWSDGTAPEQWNRISRTMLRPEHPFPLHQAIFKITYSDWDFERQGPPPAWSPTDEERRATHLAHLMSEKKLTSYADLHRWSIDDYPAFWNRMIQQLSIVFKKPYRELVDVSKGIENPRWLVDAEMNIADSCFRADPLACAIRYQRENGPIEEITYAQLKKIASQVAHGLVRAGFRPGDALAIDMAMTVESVAIYLGIVMAGCAAISIADSFAPDEIKTRLALTGAKAIFTQDYVERAGKRIAMYEKIVAAGAPRAIVVPWKDEVAGQLRDGDLAWNLFLGDPTDFPTVARRPEDATNLLFSSGTTGEPKVIPWSHTTPLKAAIDGYLHHDIHPGDIVAWPTNLGWMMGPWLIYASLVNRATIALYYGAPTGRDFGTFIEQAKVKMLGLVPSIVKAWRASDCMKGLDWSSIKAFSSTGECSNADDYLFLMSLAGYRPVVEYCGGTEIGGGFLTGTLVQPASPATFSTTAMGIDIEILNDEGRPADKGEIFLCPPSIGLSLTLLNRDHFKVYYEGVPKKDGRPLRRHGDEVERLPNGYYRALGRADDTMNLGGIKVSSAEIERVLNHVSGVSETAAIAVNPPGGGPSLLVVYAVLTPGTSAERAELKTAMQKQIKEKLNPLFKVEDVFVLPSLPRTASNKVMRRKLRELAP